MPEKSRYIKVAALALFTNGIILYGSSQLCALVAQSVEQVTLNHWVHGSSPCGRTIFFVFIPETGFDETSAFSTDRDADALFL